MDKPKTTSYEYGKSYQILQAQKYYNRANNHWKHRIELAKKLANEYAFTRIPLKSKQDIVVGDIGCSIGTFALEFARMGYTSFGIDFDKSALEIARDIATKENIKTEFICGDISDASIELPDIDVAICFDIFEHLHDDELGAFISSLRRRLSPNGSLIFHTFPTEYDYIFQTNAKYLMIPFATLDKKKFIKLLKAYSCLLDIYHIARRGITHREAIANQGHCNPTTSERLTEILQRAGYDVLLMETANLYPSITALSWFSRQSISNRNLYGVAIPK